MDTNLDNKELLEQVLQKLEKNEQDNQEILNRLHDIRYKTTKSIEFDELYNEIENRFGFEEDINYLYIKFCEATGYEYKEVDIMNLVRNLDPLSVDYVKSWLMKKTMLHSPRYNLVAYTIPKRVLKYITPKCDHELIDHPQRYLYDRNTIALRKKYNLDACYSLLVKGAGVEFLPQEHIDKIAQGVVIDGGSFDGQTSIMFATYAPKKVYAFDPIEKHLTVMQKAIDDNNLTDMIEVVPYGLDEKDNEFVMELETEGEGTTLLGRERLSQENTRESYVVKTTSIDNFVKKNNIEKISLIKLDVEGFEQKVINGMLKTLKKDKPALLISIYHMRDDAYEDFIKIKPFIEDLNLGYKLEIRDFEPMRYDNRHDTKDFAVSLYLFEYMLVAYI